MIQSLIVAAIVAGAALWLGRKWIPAPLRARLHLSAGPSCTGGAKTCGTKGCNGCH